MKNFPKLIVGVFLVSCSSPDNETDPTPVQQSTTEYTLTISSGTGGSVSTSGGTYEDGSTVSITAIPNSEYIFQNWSNGSTDNPLTITVNQNITLTANFIKRKYPLTINIQGEGTVREEIVSSGKSTPTEYNSGTVVRLTADPTGDWVFEEWTGNVTETSSTITITLDEPKTVNVRFMRYFNYNQPSYFLTLNKLWIRIDDIFENSGIEEPYRFAIGAGDAFADFNQDGYIDWLCAPSYWTHRNGEYPLKLFLNQRDDQTFTLSNSFNDLNFNTWNARKSIIGDFNLDGKPDVVYAEHGIDDPGIGGDGVRPSLLMSSEQGYQFSKISNYNFFLHSGGAADFDNDGDLDVILSDQQATIFYLNDGAGNFQEFIQYTSNRYSTGLENNNYLILDPSEGKNGFVTFELIDINNDGYVDLIGGGDENTQVTRVYYGNGINFTYERSKVIPFTDPWRGIIDFDFLDLNNDGTLEIFTSRHKNVYEGYFIDVVSLDENQNYQVINNIVDNTNAENNRWSLWMRVMDIDNDGKIEIITHNKNEPYHWEWNGSQFVKRF